MHCRLLGDKLWILSMTLIRVVQKILKNISHRDIHSVLCCAVCANKETTMFIFCCWKNSIFLTESTPAISIKKMDIDFILETDSLQKFIRTDKKYIDLTYTAERSVPLRAFRILGYILENFSIKKESIIKVTNRMYQISLEKRDIQQFSKCCNVLTTKYNVSLKYIAGFSNLYKRLIRTANRKLYFWWIPICYDTERECGKRMMKREWERIEKMYD